MRFPFHVSLTSRILALNILSLLLLWGGLSFLESYRERLYNERIVDAQQSARLVATLLPQADPRDLDTFIARFAMASDARLRIYGEDGEKRFDSFALATPVYTIREPEEGWLAEAAMTIDVLTDFLVDAETIEPFVEPEEDNTSNWRELRDLDQGETRSDLRYAPDRTPVISAGARSAGGSYSILLTSNPREVRAAVRSERASIALFGLLVLLLSAALSFYLARTIVKPMRTLARAAMKVRLGRMREVAVPRLPERRDEIGRLARALSDMTQALRKRIDSTEAFAADVAHEIKNPLASLRSALEGMRSARDDEQRASLLTIAEKDVLRLDRMISDISEASRVDSQLSRTHFEPVDIVAMLDAIVSAHEARSEQDGAKSLRYAFARPIVGSTIVMGEDLRLERVFENLLDNAESFSPPNGLIEVDVAHGKDATLLVRVSDEGPGVPAGERESVFRRFYSGRDTSVETRHSGLGLAISRTIVEAHQGTIAALDKPHGARGAVFEVALPLAESEDL